MPFFVSDKRIAEIVAADRAAFASDLVTALAVIQRTNLDEFASNGTRMASDLAQRAAVLGTQAAQDERTANKTKADADTEAKRAYEERLASNEAAHEGAMNVVYGQRAEAQGLDKQASAISRVVTLIKSATGIVPSKVTA